MNNELYTRALEYTNIGLKIFPCKPEGKSPITAHGYLDASSDKKQIIEWWTANPNANIGIPGTLNNLFIIDIDGEIGIQNMKKLSEKLGSLPKTWTVKTGSGGYHMYFRKPDGKELLNRTNTIAEKIDVRTAGSVIAPPSIHPNGNPYEWCRSLSPLETSLATLPAAWEKAFRDAEQKKQTPHKATGTRFQKGSRNDDLYRSTCSFIGLGFNDPEKLLERVQAFNLANCKPPLAEKEVNTIVNSALKGCSGQIDDISVAEMIRPLLDGRFCYVASTGRWWTYSEGIWTKCSSDVTELDEVLQFEISSIVDEAITNFASVDPEEERKYKSAKNYLDKLKRYKNTMNRRNVLQTLRPLLSVRPSVFDKNKDLLCCKNVVLNVKTRETQPHSPKLYLTRKCNADYIPDASFTPWNSFISEIMSHDSERMHYLQAVLGYAMSGKNNEDKFFLLLGRRTRNGKSTLCNAISGTLGNACASLSADSISVQKSVKAGTPREDLLRIKGTRLMICPEPAKNTVLDSAFIKQLTGRDTIVCRGLYDKSSTEFKNSAVLILNTNYLPAIKDPSIFLSKRAVVIPFERHFEEEEQDKTLSDQFASDSARSAILNWLLEGLDIYGTFKNGFTDAVAPSKVLAETEEYTRTSDAIACFIHDKLEPETSLDLCASRDEMLQAYRSWCLNTNHGEMNSTNFKEAMEAHGYTTARRTMPDKSKKWIYMNARIKKI